MKKKIISIIGSILLVVAVSILLSFGILKFIRKTNVEQTGNILGVSWYNETDKEFTITTKEELYEFAKLSDFYDFENQTVKLGADIVVNEGNASEWDSKSSLKKWNPINGFAGVFDGQGHTISGIYGKAFDAPMALFVKTNYNCIIKDLKLVNSYFETTGESGTSSFVSKGGGEFVKLYSDAIINCKGEHSGGIASSLNAQSILDECWFDGKILITGRDGGGIVDEIIKSRVTMRHCLFSGEIESTYKVGGPRIGGFCGRLDNKGSLIVTDSLVTGTIKGATNSYIGSAFGRLHEGTEITSQDSYVSMDTYSLSAGANSASTKGVPVITFAENLVGIKAYQWTTLDFENYWTTVEGDTPILRSFAETTTDLTGVEKEFDISWYKNGASTFEIANAKQLYGFYIISATDNFSGKIVKLTNDIVVNTRKASTYAKKAPQYKWLPIHTFIGTFDGQGHSISGIYLKDTTKYLNYNGLFSIVSVGGVLKNFKLVNSYFERTGQEDGYGFVGGVVADIQGTIDTVYSDAIIVTDGQQAGGIVARANGVKRNGKNVTVTVNNCWYAGRVTMTGQTGRYGGGVVGLAVQGNVNISNCLNTGSLSAEAVDTGVHLGGILASDNVGGNINITGCLNTGKLTVAYDTAVASVLARVSSSKTVVTIKDTYATTESYPTAVSKAGFRGKVIGGVLQFPAQKISGINGYRYTALDFAKYWSAKKDSTPVLTSFAGRGLSTAGVKKAYDLSWYNADAKTYTIKTPEQLLGFALMSAMDDFKGKKVMLGADIVFNQGDAKTWGEVAPKEDWVAIGTAGKPFAGTFDGQGHTISGIYMKDTSEGMTYSGLFGVTATGSVVKNFRLTNSYFERTGQKDAYGFVGSVVSELRGTLDTVYSNAIVKTDGSNSGGLVARANGIKVEGKPTSTKVTNCWFDGEFTMTTQTGRYGAGIIGIVIQGTCDVTNCLNTGRLSAEAIDTGVHLAGIVGSDNAGGTINIKNCLNAGPLTVNYGVAVGSILGRAGSSKTVVNIENTYATKESFSVAVSTSGRKGTVNGSAIQYKEAQITGYGGYQFTMLDFNKYWAVNLEGTPILKSFAAEVPSLAGVKKMIDTSWYKKDKYVIDSVADLYGLSLLSATDSFEGKTITLGKNIKINSGDAKTWGTNAPQYAWTAIGSTASPFKGTFDGAGHTISGVYLNNNEYYQGLFSCCDGATIKNLRLVNSYFETAKTDEALIGGMVGLVQGKNFTMKNVYSDAIVKGASREVGGMIGYVGMASKDAKVNMTSCWFDGEVYSDYRKQNAILVGGFIGNAAKGTVIMDTCHLTGDVTADYICNSDQGTWGACVGGYIGNSSKNCAVQIINSLSAGTIKVNWHKNTNGVADAQADITRCGQFIGYDESKEAAGQTIYALSTITTYVENTNTTRNRSQSWANISNIIWNYQTNPSAIYGGVAQFCRILPFAKSDRTDGKTAYWTAVEGTLPVPATLMNVKGGEAASAISGEGTAENPYLITDAKDLQFFANVSRGHTFEGQYVTLDKDIVVNEGSASDWYAGTNRPGTSWTAIGSTSSPFKGTFDGAGHSISGVYLNNNEYYQGLFSACDGATIKNVRLVNSYFETTRTDEALIGGMVGLVQGASFTMENVYSDAIVKCASREVGGMIGYIGMASNDAKVNMTSCWFDGDVYADYRKQNAMLVGGFIGIASKGTVVIDTCLFTGDVTADYTCNSAQGSWGACVGGFIGSCSVAQITNSISSGTIKVNWHKNTNGVADAQSDISRCGQFIGYAQGVMQSGQTIYAISTLTTYVERTNNTRDRSGSWAQVSNIIWDYLKNPSALYGGAVKFITNLPFAAEDRTDGKTAYWVAMENALPVPSTLTDVKGGTVASVIAGSGTESNPYVISSAADLMFIANLSQGRTFEGQYITLGKDIVVNEGSAKDWNAGNNRPTTSWTPIGNSNYPFKGTFDGKGYSISGVYLRNDGFYQGLFSYCDGATIQNFNLKNSYFEDTRAENEALWGSIVGWAKGASLTMKNVYSDAIMKSRSMEVGGLIGYVYMNSASSPVNLTSCWYDGDISVDYRRERAVMVGGFLGNSARGAISMDTCSFTGNIMVDYICNSNQGTWGANVGGFAAGDSSSCSIQVKNSLSAGTIKVNWKKNTNDKANAQSSITRVDQFLGQKSNSNTTSHGTYALSKITTYIENTNTTKNASQSSANLPNVIWDYQTNPSQIYGEAAKTKTVLPFKVEDRTDGGTAIWATVEDGLPVPATLKKAKTNDSQTQ